MSGYYHLSASIVSRSDGRSAVACAAYRAGQILEDERYGKTHDYHRRRGIADHGIEVPGDAPAWAKNREALWNAVEAREKRKDAQLAREFELSFPHQLNGDERHELLIKFIREEFTSKGIIADWAIHAPGRAGDQRNWHAHVMTTMRIVTEDGFDANKDRSLNRPEQLQHWREAWAETLNKFLTRDDIQRRIGGLIQVDHRSYADRGITLEPTQHLGVHAMAMERRGVQTERGDFNREVAMRNAMREPHRRTANYLAADKVAAILRIRKEERLRHSSSGDHTPEP